MARFVTVEITVPVLCEEGTPEHLKAAVEYKLAPAGRFSLDHRLDWHNITVTIPEQVGTPQPRI